MKIIGELQYYRSKVDRDLHPYAVCTTDTTDESKPLILEVSPEAISNLPRAVTDRKDSWYRRETWSLLCSSATNWIWSWFDKSKLWRD